MAKVTMTKGKFNGINACADQNGVIAAAAMDQRGSLQKSIAKARGANGAATDEDMVKFKKAVTQVLTRYASAILLDPEYGLEALKYRAPNTGVLLAYEKTGYDVTIKGRLPDLLPEWSVRRLVEAGADVIKILLYYNPGDDPENQHDQAGLYRAHRRRVRRPRRAVLPGSRSTTTITWTSKSLEFAKAQARERRRATWRSSPSRATAWTCSRSKCR